MSYVKIAGLCPSAVCTIGDYKFEVTGLTNPNYVEPLTGDFTVDTSDSTDGVVNRGKNTTAIGEILPRVFTNAVTLTRSAEELGAVAIYSGTFKTDTKFKLIG
jgi:hypothetical protein